MSDTHGSTNEAKTGSDGSANQDKTEKAPVSVIVDALLEPAEEQEQEEAKPNGGGRHRGVYLLPNLVTTVALFSGFYAILASMDGKFEAAAIANWLALPFCESSGGRTRTSTRRLNRPLPYRLATPDQ